MLPRLTVLPFLLISLGLATSSHAAPDDLSATIPVSSPWHTPVVLGADLPPPVAAQPNILFINYDGGKMHGGCGNDPHGNCSWIMNDTVLPYSGDAGQRAAVVQFIRKDFEAFAIKVTDVRPPDNVDYDMEMVGDWSPAPQGGFAGVAPSIDCYNQNGGETSFTLDYTPSAGGIAKAILQEAAHTWGLEHVESKGDLLYPTTAGVSNPTFEDKCSQIVVLNQSNQVEPSNGECVSQHKQFCGSGDQQNSFQELLMIFGPSEPDLSAPLVSITSPAQGAEVGDSFELVIHAEDENSPQLLKLDIVGTGPSEFKTDTYRPSPSDTTFPIQGLPAGDYTISVTATDEDDNLAMAKVDFTVVGAPTPSTTGEETTGTTTTDPTTGEDTTGTTDDTGAAESTSDEPGTPTTTDTPMPTTTATSLTGSDESSGGPMGEAGSDDGCSCHGGSGGGLALLLPLAFGLRRRRRA